MKGYLVKICTKITEITMQGKRVKSKDSQLTKAVNFWKCEQSSPCGLTFLPSP
jgi:hypothetical protein